MESLFKHRTDELVLALDVSSKTGWALFANGALVSHGTVLPEKEVKDFGPYPYNYVQFADYIVKRIVDEVVTKSLEAKRTTGSIFTVVIEETNTSRQNYSQKCIEFIHSALIRQLIRLVLPVRYIRTGEWRKKVEAHQSSAEKKLNSKIYREKTNRNKKIDSNPELSDAEKTKLKRLPVKIDGKVVGRKGRKHVAIRVVQELFGIELKQKDNDAADAILLGLSFLRGAPVCDGTVHGGKSTASKTSEAA